MRMAGAGEDTKFLAEGIAVVTCESHGDRTATSPNPESGGTNRSIWQIDDGSHSISNACALDNLCATRKALGIHATSGWAPWACAPSEVTPDQLKAAADGMAMFRAGDLGAGAAGIENAPIIGGAIDTAKDAINAVPDAIGALAGVLERIARFFVGLGELLLTPEGWLRIGKLLGGAILVLWALNAFAKQGLGVDATRGIKRVAFAGRNAITGPPPAAA